MQPLRIDGSRLILLLIGVCLGMTLVATVSLWSQWSHLMRALVLVADVLWIVGASHLIVPQIKREPYATRSELEAGSGGAEER